MCVRTVSARKADVGHHDVHSPAEDQPRRCLAYLTGQLGDRDGPSTAYLHDYMIVLDAESGKATTGEVGDNRANRPGVEIVHGGASAHRRGDGVKIDTVD